MCTYLKNIEGYKLKDLKFKEFDYIQEMFDRAFKRVNTFEDFRTELVEGKEKRAGTELIQENAKNGRLGFVVMGDLKTMFEPHVEDKSYRGIKQEYKSVRLEAVMTPVGVTFLGMLICQIYMLVEKKYPLALLTLSMMLEKKLIIDYESEMAYQLLKYIIKQLKKKNRALEDMVNANFLSPGLSHDMWGKAIISTTYLLDKIHWGYLAKISVLNPKEIRRSSGIDDEVVQDQRQWDDNDLQDER
ncbi:hypothetical protein Tco_1541129 [Tanacetum coccineum]